MTCRDSFWCRTNIFWLPPQNFTGRELITGDSVSFERWQVAGNLASLWLQNYPAINNHTWQRRQSPSTPHLPPPSLSCSLTCASCLEADQWELRLGMRSLNVSSKLRSKGFLSGPNRAGGSTTQRQRMGRLGSQQLPLSVSHGDVWPSCTLFSLINTAANGTKSHLKQKLVKYCELLAKPYYLSLLGY